MTLFVGDGFWEVGVKKDFTLLPYNDSATPNDNIGQARTCGC